MLILSRKSGERILIGDTIIVSVLETKGDQVKIGIDAPKEIRVYRHEIYEAIQAENKAAALSELKRISHLPDDYFSGNNDDSPEV